MNIIQTIKIIIRNKYYRKNNMSKRMKNYVPDEWALEIISESELNMLKELERED